MYEQHTLKSENEIDAFLLAIFGELSVSPDRIVWDVSLSLWHEVLYFLKLFHLISVALQEETREVGPVLS